MAACLRRGAVVPVVAAPARHLAAAPLPLPHRHQQRSFFAWNAPCLQQKQQQDAASAEPLSSVNPHAARAAAAAAAAASASCTKPVVGSTAFTELPAEMPSFVPLSRVNLAAHEPRLAKHSTHGYLIYHSPMERAVRAVKAFSLTSAAMALISAPVMVVLANPDMPMIGRMAIAGTVVTFGISTTIALTYFTRSYVIRVFARQDPALTPEEEAAQAKAQAEADAQLAALAQEATAAASDAATEGTAAVAAAPSAAVVDSAVEDAAARRWLLTIETLNVWGRSVFTVAPHAAVHPLFSRLFNNVRVDTREFSGEADKARGVVPVVKDLFVHMDQATNALMLPLWSKPTVIGTGRRVDLAADGAADTMGPIDRVTLSLKQATEKLEQINKEQAAKNAAAAAEAAAKEEAEKKKQ